MCIIYDMDGQETESAWVVFRLASKFKGNIEIDAYMLLDASENRIVSLQCVEASVTINEADSLIQDAYLKVKQHLPKVVLISNTDPAHDFIQKACEAHNLKFKALSQLVITPLVQKAREIFTNEQLAFPSTQAESQYNS